MTNEIEGTSALQSPDPCPVMDFKPGPVIQPHVPTTPFEMVAIAASRGASMEEISRFMDLQERMEKNEAKKAFVAAMAAFKANPPTLTKNKAVDFTTAKGRTHYRHADLDEVASQIGQALSPHGLSFRWKPEQQAGGRIRVTCTLEHALGHSESVSLEGAADDSGNKNSIQAVGSTVTYLERYTLLAITGMAVKDQDTDGRVPVQRTPEVEKTLDDALKAIAEAPDNAALAAAFNAAFAVAQKAGDSAGKDALKAAHKARQTQLREGGK